MAVFYTREDLTRAAACAKRALIEAAGLLTAGVACLVAGLIVRNRVLGLGGLTVFCMAAYFYFAMKATPQRKYRVFLTNLFSGLSRRRDCIFSSIGESTRNSEEGVEIRDFNALNEEGEPILFYWDACLPMPRLEPGEQITVTAYDRYVIGIDKN